MSMSDDDGLVCEEFSHSFLDHSNSYIVGYKCNSTALFIGIVFAAFGLVILQNILATKDGQASRAALLTKKGTKERDKIIWTLLWYTFLSSVLGTIHVLLVIGANVYVLGALLLGNLAGVYYSYRQQKMDEHDCSADLCAVLRAAQAHPNDEKYIRLRQDLLVFLQLSADATARQALPRSNSTEVSPLSIDYDCRSAAARIRRAGQARGAFAPYQDHPPPGPAHRNLQL